MKKMIIGSLALLFAQMASASSAVVSLADTFALYAGYSETFSTDLKNGTAYVDGAASSPSNNYLDYVFYGIDVGAGSLATSVIKLTPESANKNVTYGIAELGFSGTGPAASATISDDLVWLNGTNSLMALLLSGHQYVLRIAGVFSNKVSEAQTQISAVPLPAAGWLFGSALVGFITIASRRRV